MEAIKTLLVLTSVLLISCSSEEALPDFNPEETDDWVLSYWGDERKDFSCTSYKIINNYFDIEDNTSYQVLYSHNLGKKSVWLDDLLIDDNAYFDFDEEAIFTIDEESLVMYTFNNYSYQLEIIYTLSDDSEVDEIKFNCLPV